jgi:hypothetical protein
MAMHTKKLLFGLVCYSMTSSVHADTANTKSQSVHVVTKHSEEECELVNPPSFRFTTSHREANGIGYDQGYTSFAMFCAFTSIKNWHPFFDVRLHMFNDWKAAANAGFGVRYQPDSLKAIFGLNGFFDFRHANHSTFEQLGGGLEILGTKWEGRANCYFPIINSNNLYEDSFIGFTGHEALFIVKRELAFKGFDVSVGRTWLQKQYFTLSSTLGGYMFFADFDKRAKGGLFKMKAELSRYVSVEAQTSYDSLFKGIVQGQVGFNLPFGKKIKARKQGLSCKSALALANRIAESVDRFEIIVTDHHNIQTPALDPRTKEDLYIVFVNNLAPSGGNGTAEAPFSTLAAAESASAPGEMIYVYGGTNNTVGMNTGITLQDRQWLQGSSRSFAAITAYGLALVPAQTSGTPAITNTTGDTITLANNNIVTGFNLLATNNAISGSDITGFSGSFLHCAGAPLSDFAFTNVSGAITLQGIKSYSANGVFLTTTDDVVLTVEDSVFTNSGAKNLDLTFTDTSNSLALILYNVFENTTAGSTISTELTANLRIDLEENLFSNIQSSAPSSLTFDASDTSKMIAVVSDNTYVGPSILGFDFLTTDTATSIFYVADNSGTYTGTSSPAYPFNFVVNSSATSTLLLQGNVASSDGYSLANNSDLATFYVQSPDLSLSGVETLNTGSFTINGSGSITYISYTDYIPDLE